MSFGQVAGFIFGKIRKQKIVQSLSASVIEDPNKARVMRNELARLHQSKKS